MHAKHDENSFILTYLKLRHWFISIPVKHADNTDGFIWWSVNITLYLYKVKKRQTGAKYIKDVAIGDY